MIKIWLGNLGKYNEGELIGEWVELPCYDWDEVKQNIGINAEYEEYYIGDYEVDFLTLKISEYENLDKLDELAELLENLADDELNNLIEICKVENLNIDNLIETLENKLSNWKVIQDIADESDLGYYMVNDMELYDLESMGHLANYIDYEALGNDINLERGGTFTGSAWVCRN
ncbi:MAG: antirestriction protein ArdA [Firmicutes bacterium]|nr:antirestriction protein ArdA [Bacillota bacterium]